MSKNPMTALDFVISVLREHEKELTMLSDRLEEIIGSSSGEGVNRNLTDIQSILASLKKDVQDLDKKISTSGVLSGSGESIIGQIESQVSLSTQNFKALTDIMKDMPTKKDIDDLKMSIVTLTRLLQSLISKEAKAGVY